MTKPVKGSCLCGKVQLSMTEFNRDVQYCHCIQCRKQTGHFLAAANVDDDQLTIAGEEYIKWYAASDEAKRGFCSECGSMLFWKLNNDDKRAIAAGCLDAPTGLKVVANIFTDWKGDYYELEDTIPNYPGSAR